MPTEKPRQTVMFKLLRPLLAACRTTVLWFESRFDAHYLAPDVPLSKSVSHSQWRRYLVALANKPGMRVLEIGSRKVTAAKPARADFHLAEYVGFDFYDGENVDIVGDAHRLTSYFQPGEKFDLIFSSATFEHLAMPWVVAEEIAKLVTVGGHVFIETHFSYSSHERPWHFFQFSDMALRVLFSPALGFECLEAGVSNPLVGRFSSLADDHLKNQFVTGLYCHSEFLGRKVHEAEAPNWSRLNLKSVVGDSVYPAA